MRYRLLFLPLNPRYKSYHESQTQFPNLPTHQPPHAPNPLTRAGNYRSTARTRPQDQQPAIQPPRKSLRVKSTHSAYILRSNNRSYGFHPGPKKANRTSFSSPLAQSTTFLRIVVQHTSEARIDRLLVALFRGARWVFRCLGDLFVAPPLDRDDEHASPSRKFEA